MGERISVLIPLTQSPGEYAIRMVSLAEEQLIWGLGILRYPGVQERRDENGIMILPESQPHIDVQDNLLTDGIVMDEMTDLIPFPARRPPAKADHTFRFAIKRPNPSTWILASEPHQGFRQQLPPVLWNKDSRGPTTFGGMKNGSVVDIIYENGAFGMHPFHQWVNESHHSMATADISCTTTKRSSPAWGMGSSGGQTLPRPSRRPLKTLTW